MRLRARRQHPRRPGRPRRAAASGAPRCAGRRGTTRPRAARRGGGRRARPRSARGAGRRHGHPPGLRLELGVSPDAVHARPPAHLQHRQQIHQHTRVPGHQKMRARAGMPHIGQQPSHGHAQRNAGKKAGMRTQGLHDVPESTGILPRPCDTADDRPFGEAFIVLQAGPSFFVISPHLSRAERGPTAPVREFSTVCRTGPVSCHGLVVQSNCPEVRAFPSTYKEHVPCVK